VVYEDDDALAILDANSISPGHAVVLPKVHVETILELSDEGVQSFFSAVKKVVGLIKEKLSPDGFTLGINHGKVAGQAIEHLHFHVIPRFRDDGGTSLHGVVNNPPKESLEEIRKKILGDR